MALPKTMCVNHVDRPAIGVCMVTRRPICAECSTRYDGVNYSREGLEILRQQRSKAVAYSRSGGTALVVLGLFASPLALGLLYLFYALCGMELIQIGNGG